MPSQACQLREDEQGTKAGPAVGAHRAGLQGWHQEPEADRSGAGHQRGAIRKRAKRDDWSRDLSERIQEKAEQLVRKEAVRSEVRAERTASEREVVDANAQAVATIRLAHRRDIQRARKITNALLDELEQMADADTVAYLQELGEMLRSPDDNGMDKLNDLYQKVISLPERSKTMKVLAESLRIVVDMERQAFGMNDKDAGKGRTAAATWATSSCTSWMRPRVSTIRETGRAHELAVCQHAGRASGRRGPGARFCRGLRGRPLARSCRVPLQAARPVPAQALQGHVRRARRGQVLVCGHGPAGDGQQSAAAHPVCARDPEVHARLGAPPVV